MTFVFGSIARAEEHLDDLLKAWQSNQGIRSARFHWNDERYRTGGFQGKTEVTVNRRVSYSLSEGMYRYEIHGPQWVAEQAKYLDRLQLCVYDYNDGKVLFSGDSQEDRFHPLGWIHKTEYLGQKGNINLLAIFLRFRPLDQRFVTFDPTQYRLFAGTTLIEGRKCVRLAYVGAEKGMADYWVDPARQYVVVRAERRGGGRYKDKLYSQIMISYTGTDDGQWVPKNWEATRFNLRTGAIVMKSSVKIASYELNPTIEKSEFQFDFPVGTMVEDETTGKHFNVRENDTRLITENEMLSGATYQQLISTESGTAAR